MKKTKQILTILVLTIFMLGSVFAQKGALQTISSVDGQKVYSDEVLVPNPEKLNLEGKPKALGSKAIPASETLIRWSIQNENDYIEMSSEAASGPYSVKFSIGGDRIPSDNCWLDIRRPDMELADRAVPLDVSGTDRVTFWIRADEGTAPLWFRAQSFPPDFDGTNYSGEKQLSNHAFIDGETIIIEDALGELQTIKDVHFNGQWQFVSLPWKFLELYDSAAVQELLPYSEVWEGSLRDLAGAGDAAAFDRSEIRTLTWFTKPENDYNVQGYWDYEDNLWGLPGSVARGTWEIDEVMFDSYNSPVIEEQLNPWVSIFADEVLVPNPEKLNLEGKPKALGSKTIPGSESLIRWSIQNENDYIEMNEESAMGPYSVKFSIGGERIPSDNCWLDIRRPDMEIAGRAVPFDASATGRVTFWIRADEGTAPLWFRAQSFPPDFDGTNYSGEKQLSNHAFIDGETIITEDAFGELKTIKDVHFNGQWQFVSLPWKFLELYDSAAVQALLPFSEVWEGSLRDLAGAGDAAVFNKAEIRTLTWFTKPENDYNVQGYWDYEDNLWGLPGSVARGTWEIDEVVFQPLNNPESYPAEIAVFTNEVLVPNPEKLNLEGKPKALGSKAIPGAESLIRWSIQNENDFIDMNTEAAIGPYSVKFSIGGERIPSDNCWLDIRRPDMELADRAIPLDASQTDRVTFWIRADEGTAPLWFRAQSFPPDFDGTNYSGEKQLSNHAFIDGETIIIEDALGELQTIKDVHFNGQWQFVSLPWKFLELYDSAAVQALLPFSEVWEGSLRDLAGAGDAAEFDKSEIRTLTWFTKPENDYNVQGYWDYEDNLWGLPGSVARGTWEIDEVFFTSGYKDNEGYVTDVEDKEKIEIPSTYKLNNAYPNPFNPSTTISYAIPVSNLVKVDVYNIMGQKIRTLVNEFQTSGTHNITWNARDDSGVYVATGIYFIRMEASHFVATKKVMLLK